MMSMMIRGLYDEAVHAAAHEHGWEPADVPLRPVLFVNPSSGGGKAARVGSPIERVNEGSRSSS